MCSLSDRPIISFVLTQRPPMRCIVIGESNTSVEAAHELGMKCIIVSGNNPVYNFTGADLVVRDLSQLSFLNLKKLFGEEALVEPRHSSEDRIDSSSGSSSMESQYNDFADSNWGEEPDFSGDSAPRGMAFYR